MTLLFQQAVERVKAADQAAHASQLAFELGPETFIAHVTKAADEARKRIEEEYASQIDGTELGEAG